MDASTALARLRQGNEAFVTEQVFNPDLSQERRTHLHVHGQNPFATIITCADSRVSPEHIFHVGLGELFIVRVAGNVISSTELESTIYACAHLGTAVVLLLGHTQCGAIAGALNKESNELPTIFSAIRKAIGNEQDPDKASVLNVLAGIRLLRENPKLKALTADDRLSIVAGIYDTATGKVNFLEDDD